MPLKLRQSVMMTLFLLGTTVSAKPASYDSKSACNSVYQKTGPILKGLLGDANDEKLAPAIDEFLNHYAEDYTDTPSYETYMERLNKNGFKGDRDAAYRLMQRFSRQQEEPVFEKLMNLISSLEKLAGPITEANASPLDPSSLAYTKCLRDYMAKSLRGLPDHSYYELKRSELLSQIESSTTVHNSAIDPATPH